MRSPLTATGACIVWLLLAATGCASNSGSVLKLTGDPHGPAEFHFREMYYRQQRTKSGPDGGIEITGYGFIPFYNSPMSRDYNSHWPESGQVVFRIHLEPLPGERYAITVLGPALELGPGDDEVLTAMAGPDQIHIEPSDSNQIVTINNVATKSRNKPDRSFTLSGTLIARLDNYSEFDNQLMHFQSELESRNR
jgi:hypothetical protein